MDRLGVTSDDLPALVPLSGRIVRKLLACFAANEPISLLKILKLTPVRIEKRQQNTLRNDTFADKISDQIGDLHGADFGLNLNEF